MSKVFIQRLMFSFFMSCLMAFLIGAWVTFIHLGVFPGFIQQWLKAFLLAWPAGFFVVVTCAPMVQRISLLAFNYVDNVVKKWQV